MSTLIKLIAVDLDGTLLDPQAELTPRVADACRKALASGVELVPATGQRYRSVMSTVAQALGAEYVIAHNGAVVKRVADGRTIHEGLIDKKLAAALVERLAGEGYEPLVYVDGHEDGVDFYRAFGEPRQNGTKAYLAVSSAFSRPLPPFEDVPYGGIIKILVMGERRMLDETAARVRRDFGREAVPIVQTLQNWEWAFLEIVARSAGKGRALMALAAHLGIDREDTAAIGDGPNDVDLVRAAGVSVAMGNASDEVKAASDYVVSGNDRDGAAEAIELILRLSGQGIET